MIRSFARGERVGMVWVEAEVVSAILEGEAPAFWDDARAESHVVAVDERAGVAKFIRDAEVDGIGGGDGEAAFDIAYCGLRID